MPPKPFRFTPLALAISLTALSPLSHAADSDTTQDETAATSEKILPTVKVKAKKNATDPLSLKKQSSNGALGSRAQLDTPFATTVVTQQELENRQVATIGQMFANDASVVTSGSRYSTRPNFLTVRGLGLDSFNSFKINGLPIVNYGVELPYESFEQIEMLKGLSGFMYGFGAPGGIVNYVTKKPTAQATQSVDLGYKSNSIWTEHVDLGGRFGDEDRFGYRLNASHEQGGSYIKDGDTTRNSLSLALDARLTPDLLWTFDTILQNRKATGSPNYISVEDYPVTTLPSPVSGTRNLSSTTNGIQASKFQLYMTGLEYTLNPDWILSTNISYADTKRRYTEDIPLLTSRQGDYDDYIYDQANEYGYRQWQAMLSGKATTGSVEHQIVLGSQWQQQFGKYNTDSVYDKIGTGNLYHPSIIPYVSIITPHMYKGNTYDQTAFFASDTVKLNAQWSVLAGLRDTNYQQTGYEPSGEESSRYQKNNVLTPTLALMYKPQPNTTLYGSYVQSLEQGSTVSEQYKNANALLAPLKSAQYEIGLKSEHRQWSTTAALFRIERGAEYANSGNYYVQNGIVRYQGLELNGAYKGIDSWQLGANLVLLDPKYVKTNTAIDGNTVAAASKYVAALQASYSVPQISGLSLDADGKYVGASKLDSGNTIKLPAYFTPNLGVSYATRLGGHAVTFRARIENLTGHNYWYTQQEGALLVGAPRTASVNVKYNF